MKKSTLQQGCHVCNRNRHPESTVYFPRDGSVWSRGTIWRSSCQAWDPKMGSDITSAQEVYVSPPVRAISERALPPGLVSAPLKRHSALPVLDLSPIPKESPSSFAIPEVSCSTDAPQPVERQGSGHA